MPSIPRDPTRPIFIKHPLSTPHHGKKHCRKKWPHSGKTKRTATGAKDEPWRGAGCLRRGGLERSPHPHVAGRSSPREEMAPRGAPGPASPESASDRAGREKVRSRHCRTTARSSAPRNATPTPVPGRMASAATEPREGRIGLSLAPASQPCDHGRPLSLSVTATASADRASPARRLRSARRRHPLLPRAERDSAGKTARAPPPTGPIPRAPEKRLPGAREGARTRPRGGR